VLRVRKRSGWIALLAVALLAGCASGNYRNGLDAVKMVMHRPKPAMPTAAEVAAKPFFQMRASSPDAQAVLILGSVEGDMQGWYGEAGDAMFVVHGQVVRTIGLHQNLDDAHWTSADPFARGLQNLDGVFAGTRRVDWSPGYRYGLEMHVNLRPAAMEDVDILGTVHHLRRIDESVSVPAASFAAENHYWVDPLDGFIWKSHQVVAPGVPLDLIVLRPYREASR
jgi:hypothetical protein